MIDQAKLIMRALGCGGPKRPQIRFCWATALCIGLIAASARSSEQLEAGSLSIAEEKANVLAKCHGGAQHVLVVFDLDNTLLASERHLGSDQWFLWQTGLLEYAPDSKYLVADDGDALLRIWTELIRHNRMRLTDPAAPVIIQALGSKQFPLLVLTARSPELRQLTLCSLGAHRLSIESFAFRLPDVPAAPFNPFKGVNIEREFNRTEQLRFHIGAPQSVEYIDGACLGNGQDKGVLLRVLLRRSQADIKAVLFVDDQEKNTNAVFDALRDTAVDVNTIRFSGEDDRVASFLRGDKQRVHRQWRHTAKRLELDVEKQPDDDFLNAASPDDGRLSGSSPSLHKR